MNFTRFLQALTLTFVMAFVAGSAHAQNILAKIAIPSNAQSSISVNAALNKVYVSGGASSDQHVAVIDGNTFTVTDVGSGSDANVDLKTDRYWAAGVYSGTAIVRNGTTNAEITSVNTGFCPTVTSYDCKYRRMWVGAQCGSGNDPVFAVDPDTYGIIAGPIGTGGVLGYIIANGGTGRLYINSSGTSKRVNPTTFAVTTNAFGIVEAINPITNLLYAISGNNLQVINGKPDPEVILRTIPLTYNPGQMAFNTVQNHLYLGNPSGSSVEVRSGTNGSFIANFSLGAGANPQRMVADPVRGRLYVIVYTNAGSFVYVIEDLTLARSCVSNG